MACPSFSPSPTSRWLVAGLRTTLGFVVWIALSATLAAFFLTQRSTGTTLLEDLWRHLTNRPVDFVVVFKEPVRLQVGDAVYLRQGDSAKAEANQKTNGRRLAKTLPFGTKRSGQVIALLDSAGRPQPELAATVTAARLRLFDRRDLRLTDQTKVSLIRAPDTLAWTLSTLVSPQTLPRLDQEWNRAWPPARDRLLQRLAPTLRQFLEECRQLAREEAAPFLDRHREEIERLISRTEDRLDNQQLTQLFEEEVWPLARSRFAPIGDRLGQELWRRAPIWGFMWRIAFQSLPLTRDDHFQARWKEFIEEDVVPVVRSHSGEIIEATKDVSREVFSSQRFRSELHGALAPMIDDPSFRDITNAFIEEIFLDNPRFHRTVETHWSSPQVQAALRAAAFELEDAIRSMADMILGTRQTGISSEFARVLRSQILDKDARWFLVDPGHGSAVPSNSTLRLEADIDWETIGPPWGR